MIIAAVDFDPAQHKLDPDTAEQDQAVIAEEKAAAAPKESKVVVNDGDLRVQLDELIKENAALSERLTESENVRHKLGGELGDATAKVAELEKALKVEQDKNMTVAELKERLTSMGVAFDKNDSKAELQAALDKATAQ